MKKNQKDPDVFYIDFESIIIFEATVPHMKDLATFDYLVKMNPLLNVQAETPQPQFGYCIRALESNSFLFSRAKPEIYCYDRVD